MISKYDMYYVQENICPVLCFYPFVLFVSLRLDEFQHLKLSLLKHNLSEQIQDGGKLFSSVKGENDTGRK